ncbi:hypothetical protein BD560DRAFT_429289 [Blakeslea trispora]|nr:hypothetical protein BD560DRAFT_429289 [Blakeslea trispora]
MSDYKEPVYYMTEDVQRIVDELNRQSEEERRKKEEETKNKQPEPSASLCSTDLCLATGSFSTAPSQARTSKKLHRSLPWQKKPYSIYIPMKKQAPAVQKTVPFKSALVDHSHTSFKSRLPKADINSSKTTTAMKGMIRSAKTVCIKTATAIKSTVVSRSRSVSLSSPTTTTVGSSGFKKISLLDPVHIASSSSGVAKNTTVNTPPTSSMQEMVKTGASVSAENAAFDKYNSINNTNNNNQSMNILTASSGTAVTGLAMYEQKSAANTTPAAISVDAKKAKALVSMNVETIANQS